MAFRFFLSFFLLTVPCFHIVAQSYYDPKPAARHKVAKYTATQFTVHKEKLRKEGVIQVTAAYDSLNRLLVRELYDMGSENNYVFLEEKPVYDSAGQVSYVVHWNPSWTKSSFLRYPIYEGGRKIAELDSSAGDARLLRRKTFVYDSAGHLVEMLTTDSLGMMIYKDTFRYNERGLVVETAKYMMRNGPVLNSRHVNRYDGSGNLTQQVIYHFDIEEPMATVNFFYDDKGLLAFQQTFNSDGILYSETRYSYSFYPQM